MTRELYKPSLFPIPSPNEILKGASQFRKNSAGYKPGANTTKPTCVGFVFVAAPFQGIG